MGNDVKRLARTEAPERTQATFQINPTQITAPQQAAGRAADELNAFQ